MMECQDTQHIIIRYTPFQFRTHLSLQIFIAKTSTARTRGSIPQQHPTALTEHACRPTARRLGAAGPRTGGGIYDVRGGQPNARGESGVFGRMDQTGVPSQNNYLNWGGMAAKVILDNISVRNNPARFEENIELEITFTALEAIPAQLEWRVIYVGSARNEDFDQVLEEFEIGPIAEEATMKFVVECPAPDFRRIPHDELICVTALIITISYRAQEFIRVGYYVHNVLAETLPEEERPAADPATLVAHARRTVLTDKPRITKFRINWDHPAHRPLPASPMKPEAPYNSNNSLLANKMGADQDEEKLSTREEKDQNSHSLMKSESSPSPLHAPSPPDLALS